MSTPSQPQPQPHMVKGPCQACGKEMVFILPTPRIFNDIDVSVLAMAHPPSRCQECHSVHLPLIKGLSEEGVFEVIWRVAKVNRGPMIVGANDNVLKQAIAAAEFTDKLKREGN